jgi:thiamine-monophosphate kinase
MFVPSPHASSAWGEGYPTLCPRKTGEGVGRLSAMANHGPPSDPLHGEEAIIRVLAPLAAGFAGAFALQDDCAVLAPAPGTELVLKTDPVAEGVHFLAGDDPQDIAWKALSVNISDLAAKAARPIAYLMALSFPDAPSAAWLGRFAAGLAEAQARFGCHLIGGDTDRRPGPLTIAITAIGEVPQGRIVRRGTARAGDAVFVSGTLGDAALGLALRKDPTLATAWGLTSAETEWLRRRYARPEPRLALATPLRDHASACMDISDGLAKDLGRMCAASGCAGRVRFVDVPLSAPAAKALSADASLAQRIIAGGDDYEVLAAIPTDKALQFKAAAEKAGVDVTQIGETASGQGILIEDLDGRPLGLGRTGWDHF